MELGQVYLMTSSIQHSTGFYRALGFDMAEEGSRSVEFDTGRARLKLEADFDEETLAGFGLNPPGENRGNGAVIVLEVEDVDAIAGAAEDATTEFGGRILAGPRDVDWGRRLLLISDPDGYTLELSQPL